MFSNYASRFLEQSGRQDPLDRRRSTSRYVQRQSHLPYQNTNTSQSRFPFASRFSRHEAPLFHSTREDFPDEDEGEEHEREVADFYALQRSRQQFGPSHLTESSELEDDGIEEVKEGQRHDRDESGRRGRAPLPRATPYRDQSAPESEVSALSSKGKGRLVDVNLASTINE